MSCARVVVGVCACECSMCVYVVIVYSCDAACWIMCCCAYTLFNAFACWL